MEVGLMWPLVPDPFAPVNLTLLAQAADAGVSGVWVRDVPLVGSDGDRGSGYDPALLLMHISHTVPSLRILGAGVFGAPYLDPVLLARSIVTLRELTGSRFVFGLGAGDKPEASEHFGVVGSERRRQHLIDSWNGIAAALAGRPIGPHGLCLPRPHTPTDTPMWVASSDEEVWRRLDPPPDGLLTYLSRTRKILEGKARLEAIAGQPCKLGVLLHLDLVAGRTSAHLDGGRGDGPTRLVADVATTARLMTRLAARGVDQVIVNLAGPDGPAAVRLLALARNAVEV